MVQITTYHLSGISHKVAGNIVNQDVSLVSRQFDHDWFADPHAHGWPHLHECGYEVVSLLTVPSGKDHQVVIKRGKSNDSFPPKIPCPVCSLVQGVKVVGVLRKGGGEPCVKFM